MALKTHPGILAYATIFKDNPHFNKDSIEIIHSEWLVPKHPDRRDYGFTHWLCVRCGRYLADYMWHPGRLRWELVAN